jgi:hypothetical protein
VRVNIKPNKALLVLHPLVIASFVWLGVALLYSMHLSKLLIYSTEEVIEAALWIWVPIVAATFFFNAIREISPSYSHRMSGEWEPDLELLEHRLKIGFRVWVITAVFETIWSGGLPIIWLFQDTAKNYDTYGVPSIHGILKSLFLSLALTRFSLWVVTGEKRHLKFPMFALLWAVLLVDRSVILVSIIQYGLVYLRFRSVRISTFLKIAMGAGLFVLAFGVVGDLRLKGPADLFRSLAQPSDSYPEWLPSGVLWAYIYATTPMNNLLQTMRFVPPVHSLLLPNTAALLFPSFIRSQIYGNQVDDALSGQLVSNTFNASTAYIGPYQDFGYVGVFLFSVLITFICQKYWRSRNLRGALIFSVVTQCLILTLFYNHLFYLPIIFQVVWLSAFFMRKVRFGKPAGQIMP